MRKLLEERDRRAKGTEVLASHTHTPKTLLYTMDYYIPATYMDI